MPYQASGSGLGARAGELAVVRRIALVLIVLAAVAIMPATASASCEPGSRLEASDIVGIEVLRDEFPRANGTQYRLDVHENARYDQVVRKLLYITTATLRTNSAQPLPRGSYVLDGDGTALLAKLANEIEREDFFSMRLTPTEQMYIDGPIYSVIVTRCGVRTAITTIPEPQWLSLGDVNGRRFFALVDRLTQLISRERWIRVPDPMPSPSPAPSTSSG